MALVQVTLDLGLDALYVQREVLGTTWQVQVGKHLVQIRIPAEPDDPGLLVSVNVVRATVEFENQTHPACPTRRPMIQTGRNWSIGEQLCWTALFSPHDLRHRRVSLLHLAGAP